jgi:succinate dehydrogenase flavin-adding protein (antitoxin of CptAB toxin-antitoxin module)
MSNMLHLLLMIFLIQATQHEERDELVSTDALDFYILEFWKKLSSQKLYGMVFSKYLESRDPELYNLVGDVEFIEKYYNDACLEDVEKGVNIRKFHSMIGYSYCDSNMENNRKVSEFYGLMDEIIESKEEFEEKVSTIRGSVSYIDSEFKIFNKAKIFRSESRRYAMDQKIEENDKYADPFYEEFVIEDLD